MKLIHPKKRLPSVDKRVLHHSGYNYKEKEKQDFFDIFNLFAQQLWDNHLDGNPNPPVIPPQLNHPLLINHKKFYYRLKNDFLQGHVQYEFEVIEE